MVNEFIEIFSNKHNIARVKVQLQLTSRLSYKIVDRLEQAASMLKTIKAGDRNDTIMSLIEIAVPGYKKDTQVAVNELEIISKNEAVEIAENQGVCGHAIRTYLNQGTDNQYFEKVDNNIQLNNWIYFGEFSAASLDGTTYLKVYDVNRDNVEMFKYNK